MNSLGVGSPARHLVLWDGECGFCRRAKDWAERRDVGGLFQWSAYQEVPEPPMTGSLRAAAEEGIQVFTREGARLQDGAAAMFILGRLGYPWLARLFETKALGWATEAGYRFVATHRRWVSRWVFRGVR